MKRFYKSVSVEQSGSAYHVALDGRPIKTQGGDPQPQLVTLRLRQLAGALAHFEALQHRRSPLDAGLEGLAIGGHRQRPDAHRHRAGLSGLDQEDALGHGLTRIDGHAVELGRHRNRVIPLGKRKNGEGAG